MNPIFHQLLSLDEIDPRVNYMNIIPVSYTHLDVYKRQILMNVQKIVAL